MAMQNQFWFSRTHPMINWIRVRIFSVSEIADGFFFDMATSQIAGIPKI
jgi:hypothetical protein